MTLESDLALRWMQKASDAEHARDEAIRVTVKHRERIQKLQARLAEARTLLAEFDSSDEPRHYPHLVDALRKALTRETP